MCCWLWVSLLLQEMFCKKNLIAFLFEYIVISSCKTKLNHFCAHNYECTDMPRSKLQELIQRITGMEICPLSNTYLRTHWAFESGHTMLKVASCQNNATSIHELWWLFPCLLSIALWSITNTTHVHWLAVAQTSILTQLRMKCWKHWWLHTNHSHLCCLLPRGPRL